MLENTSEAINKDIWTIVCNYTPLVLRRTLNIIVSCTQYSPPNIERLLVNCDSDREQ